MERDLSITSGDELVGLNGFAKRFVLNTLLGMLGSLHDLDTNQEIRITVSAASRSDQRA